MTAKMTASAEGGINMASAPLAMIAPMDRSSA
jgi:hypothetical protein